MKIEKLSEKQIKVIKFPFARQEENLICDGAVRSGKTVTMLISFFLWSMKEFDNRKFAICGKTVQSVERNIVAVLPEIEMLTEFFTFKYKSSKHILEVSGYNHKNYYYVFGGKDSSSYMLIQGMTLAGVFFDEVALQPESFVEQANARTITEKKAKKFYNCNPEHPEHWFYKNYILDSDGENTKNSYHLHFLMSDNPILDEEDIEKAKQRWTGVFRQRYIEGLWVVAEGLVYPEFDNIVHFDEYYDTLHKKYYILSENGEKHYGKYYLSIDYGTANPFSCGLWFVTKTKAVRVKEYYYNSRETGSQKTDKQYLEDIKKFIGKRPIEQVVVDPSALSFITELRQADFKVIKAKNDVIDGIRVVDHFLQTKEVLINDKCTDSLREFKLYRWDDKSNDDKVLKEYDHAMDDIRYFCYTILRFLPPFSGFEETKLINTATITDSWK
ncbi:MAG: PBSX family phage terminase large subunit [Clostridia bacterium]|nr:PBSX family phage terminase large subunit [Clostridia bacterium]